jgi:nucleotide-binding universal stress UspA family protein
MSNSPILIAYDGSDYAKAAIKQAADQLGNGRRAIVMTVWQPYGATGFVGAPLTTPVGLEEDVDREARRVADEGAELARGAGFEQVESLTAPGDPVWQQIVEAADEHDVGIVVMGSHGRTGIPRVLMGSVAGTVASHTERPVLITHDRADSEPQHTG